MDFFIVDNVLKRCDLTGERAVVPDGVREIRSHAFLGCRNLRYIKLPDGLKRIGDEAFTGTRLCEITFPDSVTQIGEQIFHDTQISDMTIFGESFDIREVGYAYDAYEAITEDYGLDPDNSTDIMTAVQYTVAAELPLLLLNGKFDDLWMPERTRCEIIARVLKHQPEHGKFLRMIKAHLTQIFPYLLDDPESVRYLVYMAVITKTNAAECIRIAEEHHAHEIAALLR